MEPVVGYAIISLAVVTLGFVVGLHRDIRSLGERVARLEGTVETLKDILSGKETRQ